MVKAPPGRCRQDRAAAGRVRAAKSMGLRNLPSKTWLVNRGWVLAANIAADLAAWTRLLGLYDCEDLKTPSRARCATGC